MVALFKSAGALFPTVSSRLRPSRAARLPRTCLPARGGVEPDEARLGRVSVKPPVCSLHPWPALSTHVALIRDAGPNCRGAAPMRLAVASMVPGPRLWAPASARCAEVPPTRLLDDCQQDRCLARLGPGVRREALLAAAHQLMVWLSSGLQSVGHRDEAWLERGLPSS
jgi:hypothetical protein